MKIITGQVKSVNDGVAEIFSMIDDPNKEEPYAFLSKIPAIYRCENDEIVSFAVDDIVYITYADPHEGVPWSFMITSEIENKIFSAALAQKNEEFEIVSIRLEEKL